MLKFIKAQHSLMLEFIPSSAEYFLFNTVLSPVQYSRNKLLRALDQVSTV